MSKLLAVLLALSPAFAMEMKGQQSQVTIPGHRLVRTGSEWKKLWKELGKPAPKQDFKKEFAVAVFAGTRPTGGFAIVVDEPKEEGGALVVRYAILKPKGMATMALTSPYVVKVFPKSGDKAILVEERQP